MDKIKRRALVFVYRVCKIIRFKTVKALIKRQPLLKAPYVALTPSKITSGNEYFNAMDFALSKNDVRNIAVTGSYGAGKSTIIRSYMEKFRPEAFINVSLAGFEMQEKGEAAKAQEIELSILQQILYKKNRDALPDSRIDRILNRNRAHIRRVFWAVLKVAAPMGGILAIIYHEKMMKITGIPAEAFGFLDVIPYPKAVFLLAFVLTALYFITECASQVGIFDKKIKLNKVALLSGEMDLSSAETSSLLNNCLDEIVYFFSKIDNYRLVIFEDLDRLKNPEIFVKLREINKIVNNNLSDDNPLRFIYAVRDDIFSGAEARTKFFDFIIPVVPVMDSRNAFPLLNKKMKNLIPGGEECLRSTAAYISDMRSLQNIVNEYLVFSEVVDNTKRKVSLYAMVFYKNMFSHDYSLIDRKVSVLYRFISQYRTLQLHKNYFGDIDARILSLSGVLNDISREKARNSEDVRESIIYSLIPENLTGIVHFYRPQTAQVYYQSAFQQLDTRQLIRDEKAFEDLFDNSTQVSLGYQYQNQNNIIALADSYRAEISESYQQRKKTIGEERGLNFKKAEKALREAREEKRRRNAVSLAGLVTSMKREKFTEVARQYMSDISQHDLLSTEQKEAVHNEMLYGGYDALFILLSRGYLDQDFMRSRSVFHKGGLSSADNEFVKNIALGLSGEQANAEVAIDDVPGVILEISAQHLLHHDAVMHHQIVAHLLKTRDERLDEMLATLFARPGEHVLTMLSILEYRFAVPESFTSLLKRALDKNGYMDVLLAHLEVSGDSDAFRGISAEVVSLIGPECSQESGLYRRFVESLGTGIVHLIRPGRLDAFMQHIAALGVCYAALNDPLSDGELACLRFISENALYRLTQENTGVALAAELREYGYTATECEKTPWTLAQKHNLAARAYFEEQADDFARNVFLLSEEHESAITEVLAINSLSDELKIRIVSEMNFYLATLSGIPEAPGHAENGRQLSFHDLFYRYDRIEASWPELMTYVAAECNLQILAGYLSRHAGALSLSGPGIADGELYELLYVKIICNQLLNEESYQQIIRNVDINTAHFDENISDEIIIQLLRMDKIPLTPNDFTHVMNNISDLSGDMTETISAWLVTYQTEFMSDADHYLKYHDDGKVFEKILRGVMYSPHLSPDNKMALYRQYEDYYREVDEESINLSEEVKRAAFYVASDEEMRTRLMTSIISGGCRDRIRLAEMTKIMDEKELYKIFTQKTATLSLNNRDACLRLLDKLQQAGMMKESEFRDDGKVFVKMREVAPDAAG
ncbi:MULTISPECIES: hypothetical protein [unclassified Pantoea]|uniref:YobI family P-loop NTPase n=1 Tax=unclassified Pantoea TaxID=2630326 RepID=UPI001CD2F3C2|nr:MULTISPECIES: hypothetical protein [unclassified Pantoea]MCA1179733.1 hypothetical protein [Pantoea sp. alder69]MCA1252328.1 hypothetical protein [Pantoea sp. alder70]MCA1268076.1 hypothetical protein [Pantoea sp. alder81]